MKFISYLGIFAATIMATGVNAAHNGGMFRDEIHQGLDIVNVRTTPRAMPELAPGELGLAVYAYKGAVKNDDIKLFIPTTMYVRLGGGYNLGFATDRAKIGDEKHTSKNSYSAQMGLGWNLSSFVRTEIDAQLSTFKFSGLDDMQAQYRTIGGMLYFDLLKRYIETGDITRRRMFVPFMGVGAALGQYQFDGHNGGDGLAVAAPRGALGFNVVLNDVLGLDVMYQYQMMIGHKFGWDTSRGVNNISNIMVSLRANF